MSYPTNRDRKLEPRRGKGYCHGCDGGLVGFKNRCWRCGRRGRRRLKKTPAP